MAMVNPGANPLLHSTKSSGLSVRKERLAGISTEDEHNANKCDTNEDITEHH